MARRLRRPGLAALAATTAAATLLGGQSAMAASQGAHLPHSADATVGPLVAGTSAYQRGTYVWTDYAYDDRGADSNVFRGGDTQYPSGVSPNNVADLIQLQLRPGQRGLAATAVLETLTAHSNPLIGLALDLDGSRHGAASLPGSWSAAKPLGMDRLYLLGRGGGRELIAGGAGKWRSGKHFRAALDASRNTVSALLPIRLPTTGTIRAVAAVGYQDGRASWVNGSAPVMDLAFVDDGWRSLPYLVGVALDASGFATGDSAYWQDGVQSAILAGKTSPARAVATINLGRLRAGVRQEPVLRPGFDTFLYRSPLRLGEGIAGKGNSATYDGPYQPYLVHLPLRLRPGLPLIVYMHGSSQTHTSPVTTAQYDPGTKTPPLPLPEAILNLKTVIAWPLGRGPTPDYSGASQRDVLDVTRDVTRRLHLDRDRIILSGLSLGGIGAFRLGELYPDRWSLVYADVGYDQLGLTSNLTNVPVRFQNAVADPLVNPAFTLMTRRNLEAAGTVDYLSALQLRTTHQPAVKLAECVYRAGLSRRREAAPSRVRYTIDPSTFIDDPKTGVHQSYSGAFWVSDMRAASKANATVDLTTHALGKALVAGPVTTTVRQDVTTGRDFCGPDPKSQGLDGWSEESRRVREVKRPATGLLAGSLSGLSAVTIDVATAGLDRFRTPTLRMRTDHPLRLRLSGLPRGLQVVMGSVRTTAGAKGFATLHLPSGVSVVHLAKSHT